MRSWVINAGGVGLITIGVVQAKTRDGEMLDAADVEAVNGPAFDAQIGDLGVVQLLENDEVVRPRNLLIKLMDIDSYEKLTCPDHRWNLHHPSKPRRYPQ